MDVQKDMLCMIPARRGSKRLPLKNLRRVGGKPLIAYSIVEAIASKLFDSVYVATEDAAIAKVARNYGAIVPTLVPKKLCGDKAPSWKPCLYVARYLEKAEGKKYKSVLCLQPTSVLRSRIDIVDGVTFFKKGRYDFLVSVTPIDPHYFHWAVVPGKGRSHWRLYFGSKFMKERHELPDVYRPNGAIKIANIDKLKKYKNFFGPNLGAMTMPEERSIHVTTESDLKIASALLISRKDMPLNVGNAEVRGVDPLRRRR